MTMSEWVYALQHRVESLESAQQSIEEAQDEFLPRSDLRALTTVYDDLDGIIQDAKDELGLVDAEWVLVQEQAEVALDIVDTTIDRLVDAGLADESDDDSPARGPTPAMDDPPTVVERTTEYLREMEMRLYDTRETAQQMLDEKDDLGGGLYA